MDSPLATYKMSLMDYANYRSLPSLQKYIEKGGNVNVLIPVGKSKTTLLCEASKHYDTCAMNILFNCNCDINLSDADGNTPLFQATKNHKSGSVLFLLKKGAEPDIKNKWGNTPLTVALENFSHHCMELLVDSGASVNIPIKSWSLQRHLPTYVNNTVSPLLFVLLSSPSPFSVAGKLVYAGAFVEDLPEDLLYNLLSRPGIGVKFVKLFVAAGFKMYSIKWTKEQLVSEDTGDISEKNQTILDLSMKCKTTPMDLQSLCRVTIRKSLVLNKSHKGHLKKKIDRLSLPKSVLAFLKLDCL